MFRCNTPWQFCLPFFTRRIVDDYFYRPSPLSLKFMRQCLSDMQKAKRCCLNSRYVTHKFKQHRRKHIHLYSTKVLDRFRGFVKWQTEIIFISIGQRIFISKWKLTDWLRICLWFMIGETSFRNDAACHFDMTGGLTDRDDYDCLFEMTRDFSPSVAFRFDSHLFCHKEKNIWHTNVISKGKS